MVNPGTHKRLYVLGFPLGGTGEQRKQWAKARIEDGSIERNAVTEALLRGRDPGMIAADIGITRDRVFDHIVRPPATGGQDAASAKDFAYWHTT